ncbi:hypothetical protein CS022_18285 [Veronia nyctiphanis]|uniref:Uncharacterized protein n=2 Tax=Veronia nyctiphanis TaxID=1278244 RepID=A0A4Q0YNQ2_9GAMM|nr:hypothetical protein CS022_18005 [Veronia nyctiphanis]RXJ72075.1 hypothetical protein CS022_18285 [Veronia nyctiphanis]
MWKTSKTEHRAVHTSEFDEWGNCPQCGQHEADCECPGPADLFMNGEEDNTDSPAQNTLPERPAPQKPETETL